MLALVGCLFVALALPSCASAGGPSGVALPSGNLNGWKQIFTEDFDRDAGTGSFPGAAYGSKWDVYKDGTPDTTGKATYMPSKVLSAHDGILDWYLHSEGGRPLTATTLPRLVSSNAYMGTTYGRFVTRFKITETAPHYSQVFLLWPDSERWPADGEFDFPAGDLGDTIGATAIHANSNLQREQFQSNYTFTTWHTAALEWAPGNARFYVDGNLIGSTSSQVASNPMHYVLQMEATETSDTAPSAGTSTHMQLDWFAAYSYSPSTVASPGATTGDGTDPAAGGNTNTAAIARIGVKPGHCKKTKARTVSGSVAIRFPSKAKRRAVRMSGKRIRRFSNIDTTSLTNGAHKIAVGYNKPGHRRMHGCAWVNVAN
jgi:beta-glucanase (GH16 family)